MLVAGYAEHTTKTSEEHSDMMKYLLSRLCFKEWALSCNYHCIFKKSLKSKQLDVLLRKSAA